MMKLLILFILCNVVNVVLNTIKALTTLKGGKMLASIVSAITYGFYTYIIVLTNCELDLLTKCIIVGLCNFIGVYVVKYIDERLAKEKLWKIEFTINVDNKSIIAKLNELGLCYNYNEYGKHTLFTVYAKTKHETNLTGELVKAYNGKYFITQSQGKLNYD